MSEEQTQRLIEQLADDLTPVRRVPRLRSIAAGVLAVSALVLAYSVSRAGVRADWWQLMTGDASYAVALLGLSICGLGATLAALAGALPGREAVFQRSGVAAGLGLAFAAVAGIFSLVTQGSFAGSLDDDWGCLRSALLLSPLPIAAVLFAASRGWVAKPGLTAIAALAGAAGAGAVGIHLACELGGARHILLGHLSAPVLLALVASLPAAMLLRRLAR